MLTTPGDTDEGNAAVPDSVEPAVAEPFASPPARPLWSRRMRVALAVLGCILVAEALYCYVRMPHAWKIDLTIGEPSAEVLAAAWSPDGSRILVSDGEAEAVQIYDSETGERLSSLPTFPEGYRAAWSPEGDLILGWGSNEIACWEASSGRRLWYHREREIRPRHAEFSPDGRLVVLASRGTRAELRDSRTGEVVRALEGHTADLVAARFSPDGTRVLTCSSNSRRRESAEGWSANVNVADPTCRIWDTNTGELLLRLEFDEESSFRDATWSPDGGRVVAWGVSATMRAWDTRSGETVFDKTSEEDVAHAFAYSPDGACAVSSSSLRTYIAVRDSETLALRSMLVGHAAVGPDQLVFSPDSRLLCSATGDGNNYRVYVWDVVRGECVGTLRREGNPWVVEFSPDGRRLLVIDDEGPAAIWIP